MKRILLSACALLLISVLLLTLRYFQKPKSIISKELGIDVSSGNEISYFDTHGGFHGDGKTYGAFTFSDNSALDQIRESTQWKEFPLDETVKTLVYGTSDEMGRTGPYLTDEEGNALIPQIQEGYYLLLDRQAQDSKAVAAETDILFNFTVGLYDVSTNILYFYRLDI